MTVVKRLYKYRKILSHNPVLGKPAEGFMMTKDVHSDTAMLVLAPAMNAFVLWVLQSAVSAGKKRLYFLARDGYLMYRTACTYCENLKLPIECRYIYCSRYSVRIPMFHMDMEEAMDYICRGGIDVSLIKILDRAGLDDEEKKKVIRLLHMEGQEKAVIPYARLGNMRQRLEKCREFTKAVEKHSKDALPAFKGYLEQEGLLDDVSAAIVDSGWIGSMQKILNRFLKTMGRTQPIDGYYWGLYELPAGTDMAAYHCFYFSPPQGLKRKVYFSNCLFEAVFGAPHGMTLAYENRQGQYMPVYAAADKRLTAFIKKTESYMDIYTKKLSASLENLENTDSHQNRKTVEMLLSLFMGKPTRKEAETYGRLPFSDDVLENEKNETAAIFTEDELKTNHVLYKALIMLGIKKARIKESAWYEGSAVRCSSRAKWHCSMYRLYKYVLYIRKTYLWRRNNV